MCGFVGMVALNGAPADLKIIDRMSSRLQHRGPDGAGTFVSGSVAFGFRRLSILDLSPSGNQPMFSPDGQTVLVFNGEIYNYVELRKELRALGHEFKSTGDTEVLLHAYMEWGRDCLPKLNGMWAFLIYDRRKSKIFGSRDRFGEKPLYSHRSDDRILFSSEIKGILASGHYQEKPNWKTVSRFLYEGRLDQPGGQRETFYHGIGEIPAGTAFELDLSGHLQEWKYWFLPERCEPAIKDPAEAFYELFEDSLRLRLRSDVPVATFLSGGLDSTSIACAWAKINRDALREPIVAFTYQPTEFDESRYINDTVKRTGAELVRFEPHASDLWQRLERVIWYQDEPVHSLAAVISFELTRLASERGVKVILNGGGPDEYLAGYHAFFPNYWSSLLRSGQVREVWREIRAYCLAHGGEPTTLFRSFLLSQSRAELGRTPALRQFGLWLRHRRVQRNPWFTQELCSHLEFEKSAYSEPTLETVLRRSVEQTPLPLYLRIEDRNSMAHSVEMRMPYLDHRLVSFAFQLPAWWKMNGPWNKYALRNAMRHRIPESVRTRLDKFGFPAPLKSWFADGLYQPMQDLLCSQGMRERGIYNLDRIRRDLELHRQGKVDVTGKLFTLAQFEIWFKLQRNGMTFSSPKPMDCQRVTLQTQRISESVSTDLG